MSFSLDGMKVGEGSGWVSGSAKIRELCGDKSVSQQLSSGQLEKCIGLLLPIEIAGADCFRGADLSLFIFSSPHAGSHRTPQRTEPLNLRGFFQSGRSQLPFAR